MGRDAAFPGTRARASGDGVPSFRRAPSRARDTGRPPRRGGSVASGRAWPDIAEQARWWLLLGAPPVLAAAALACAIAGAGASELVYRPISPGFGGSPFNADYVLGLANANNDFRDPSSSLTRGDDITDRFVRSLQSRLLSGLAGQVTDAIFGENPQESGTFTVGDTTVSFVRGLETITLEIVNNLDGTTTVIEVPTITVED